MSTTKKGPRKKPRNGLDWMCLFAYNGEAKNRCLGIEFGLDCRVRWNVDGASGACLFSDEAVDLNASGERCSRRTDQY